MAHCPVLLGLAGCFRIMGNNRFARRNGHIDRLGNDPRIIQAVLIVAVFSRVVSDQGALFQKFDQTQCKGMPAAGEMNVALPEEP
jgi:hypothetical protein